MCGRSAPEYSEPLVTVEEYLRTSDRPDCDDVDERVEKRNVGEFEHALFRIRTNH